MLSENELIRIARDECVEMIGKSIVMQHRDLCCSFYSITDNEDGLFHYGLGMDTEDKEAEIGDETPMEFYAFVAVNPETGEVTRNYKDSILPR